MVDGTAAEAPLNRRERNKARTRRAIEEAALELFGEHGFEGTTAEMIAEKADVSLRTFFRYFPSKELVLYGFQTEVIDRFREALAAQPPDLAPLDAVRAAYAEYAAQVPYERSGKNQRFLSIFRDAPSLRGRSGQMLLAWEGAVVDGLRLRSGGGSSPGEAPDELDPELVGAVVGAVLKWATRTWMADPQSDLHAIALTGLDRIDVRATGATAAPATASTRRRRSR